MTQALGTLPHF